MLVHRRPHNHSYHSLEVFELANNGYNLTIFNYILILVTAAHMKHQNANITRNVSCVPGLPVHAGSTKARSVHGIQPTPSEGDIPTHLKNMSSSVGMMTFPKKWKVIEFHGSKAPTSYYCLLVVEKRLVTFGVLVESP